MDISNIAFNKHSYHFLDQYTKIDRDNREASKTTFKRNSDNIYELQNSNAKFMSSAERSRLNC